MKKVLIWLVAIAAVLFGAFQFMQYRTKQKSPEMTAEYKKDGTEISVFYCSPSKRGREIFGKLVPYGQVWRTGANEATTFTTNKDLMIGGKTLAAGKYTLWTIPEASQWTVIFNSKLYGWGVTWGSEAAREPETDVLSVQVPAQTSSTEVEKFAIGLTDSTMTMAWDKTQIAVPIKK